MSTHYSTYLNYKPSGIDWLGDIPIHWDVWKIAHGFKRIGSGTTPKSDNPLFYDGNIPWVTTSELRETIIFDTAQKVTEEAVLSHSALKIYPKGSLVIAMYGATIGRLGMLGVDATFNQACCVYAEPNVFDVRFVYYWLWMRRPILISLSNGGGQPNLNQDDLKKLWIPIPDIPEQKTISSFLDFKTAQIDALIAKKQALLEKLAEKRTALIIHAVTKGLDPAVPMKNSGVDWLGKVPEHWDVLPLKYAVMFQRGHDLPADDRVEGDVPLVSSSGISSSHNQAIAKGPGIVTGRYGTIGKFTFVEDDYWPLNTTLYSVNTYKNYVMYIWYMMHLLSDLFILNSKKGAVPGVDRNDLHPILTVLPPRVEQEEIVIYLDHAMKKLESQTAKVMDVIERLQEYRSALITNAVTGKIDVRQWQAPQEVA